jgi:hypothetical protein
MEDIACQLMAWKLMREGQSALARLKGSVKKVHKDSQGCARGIIVGTYGLFLQILSMDANEIVPLCKQGTSALLLNDHYLDTIIQVSTYLESRCCSAHI